MVDDKHFSFVAPFRVFFAMNFMKFHNVEKMKKYVFQYGVHAYSIATKNREKSKYGRKWTRGQSYLYVYKCTRESIYI